MAVAIPAAAQAADPIAAHFERACLGNEAESLLSSPSGPWIEDLCRREGDVRAARFRAADEAGRFAELAAGCRDWFTRNERRFSRRAIGDRHAWLRMVEARCTGEAREELARLAPAIAAEPAPPPPDPGDPTWTS